MSLDPKEKDKSIKDNVQKERRSFLKKDCLCSTDTYGTRAIGTSNPIECMG